jgi:hypothetical protein
MELTKNNLENGNCKEQLLCAQSTEKESGTRYATWEDDDDNRPATKLTSLLPMFSYWIDLGGQVEYEWL